MWLPGVGPDVNPPDPRDDTSRRLDFPDQCVREGTVRVSVTTPADGVVTLVTPGGETDPGDAPVYGASERLPPGRHEAVPVPLSGPLPASRRLVAVLLLDASGDDHPDFDGSDEVARDDAGAPLSATASLAVDCADCRADPPLVVDRVHADAAGREVAALDDEFVVVRHVGCRPLSLGGWSLSFGAGDGQYWAFPGSTVLLPNQTLAVVTGDPVDSTAESEATGDPVDSTAESEATGDATESGTDHGPTGADRRIYLGRDRPVLHNRHDRVRLWDDSGRVVDERSW